MQIELLHFKVMGDKRGSLIALEGDKNIPFAIKRVYYIFATKENIRRGYHAHKTLKQVLICTSGSCKILLDDGKEKSEILLDSPDTGLIVEKFIWHEMFAFTPGAVLMVLASDYYEENDYIRDYKEFLEVIE